MFVGIIKNNGSRIHTNATSHTRIGEYTLYYHPKLPRTPLLLLLRPAALLQQILAYIRQPSNPVLRPLPRLLAQPLILLPSTNKVLR